MTSNNRNNLIFHIIWNNIIYMSLNSNETQYFISL